MQPISTRSPKLLGQLRLELRANHYSYRTEQAYVRWVQRFLRYQREQNRGVWKHPQSMGKAEVEDYLTWLAVPENVAPSTQNQAFSALLYFWKHVLVRVARTCSGCRAMFSRLKPLKARYTYAESALEQKLPEIKAGRGQAKLPIPVVLTQAEVSRLLPSCRFFVPLAHFVVVSLELGHGLVVLQSTTKNAKSTKGFRPVPGGARGEASLLQSFWRISAMIDARSRAGCRTPSG